LEHKKSKKRKRAVASVNRGGEKPQKWTIAKGGSEPEAWCQRSGKQKSERRPPGGGHERMKTGAGWSQEKKKCLQHCPKGLRWGKNSS